MWFIFPHTGLRSTKNHAKCCPNIFTTCEVETINVPILQMRKMKLTNVKSLAQGDIGAAQIQTQVCQSPKSTTPCTFSFHLRFRAGHCLKIKVGGQGAWDDKLDWDLTDEWTYRNIIMCCWEGTMRLGSRGRSERHFVAKLIPCSSRKDDASWQVHMVGIILSPAFFFFFLIERAKICLKIPCKAVWLLDPAAHAPVWPWAGHWTS